MIITAHKIDPIPANKTEHFIADQRWSLLGDFENPKQWIERIQPRAFSVPSPESADANLVDPWTPIDDRYDVLQNRLSLAGTGHVDLSRFVFTTDSGLGKSIAIDWICAGINHKELNRISAEKGRVGGEVKQPGEMGWMAFNIPRSVLTDGPIHDVHDRVQEYMVSHVAVRLGLPLTNREPAKRLIERHWINGRLLLLFDGLDHLPSVEPVVEIIHSTTWADCAIGLGARPFTLNNNWDALFQNDSRWRFIRVETFTHEQQQKYLTPEKWESVNESARHLLAIPRVIKYVKRLTKEELANLKTASDVFYAATNDMIVHGLRESHDARLICGADKAPENVDTGMIEMAFRMLSAIAFEMVNEKVTRAIFDDRGQVTGYENPQPNFAHIKRGDIDDFKQKIAKRVGFVGANGIVDHDKLNRAWNGLSALNNQILDGFFDTGVEGLTQVQFSNRSLQEFFCAYYLSKYCGLDNKQKIDSGVNDFLWDWIYLPLQPETHHYYEIWMYLCEMPGDAIKPDVWLESIAPIYSPARFPDGEYGNPEKRVTKRSNEMIFRSWNRLEQFIQQRPRAFEIRENWWNEFETKILADDYGDEARKQAEFLKNDFLEFPPGEVWMGIPDDKCGKPNPFFEDLFGGMLTRLATGENIDSIIADAIDGRDFGIGKAGEELRNQWKAYSRQVLLDGNLDRVKSDFALGANEHWHRVTIEEHFSLARRPCTNAWFRLYSTGHGSEPAIKSDYQAISPDPDSPAIYVSFVDAWAICQWLRWEGNSCQLPWEDWWECACKYGTKPECLYWWESAEPDPDYMTFDTNQTAPANPMHANPATKVKTIDPTGDGVMEMLGNVREHCQDCFESKHVRSRQSQIGEMNRSRVLRGGSCNDVAFCCSSAFRCNGQPTYLFNFNGVRFSRVRKT